MKNRVKNIPIAGYNDACTVHLQFNKKFREFRKHTYFMVIVSSFFFWMLVRTHFGLDSNWLAMVFSTISDASESTSVLKQHIWRFCKSCINKEFCNFGSIVWRYDKNHKHYQSENIPPLAAIWIGISMPLIIIEATSTVSKIIWKY